MTLLITPSTEAPLNVAAGSQCEKDKSGFEAQARSYVSKYAQ